MMLPDKLLVTFNLNELFLRQDMRMQNFIFVVGGGILLVKENLHYITYCMGDTRKINSTRKINITCTLPIAWGIRYS